MIITKYCFVKNECIGMLTIDSTNGEKKMQYIENTDNLSQYARNWIKYFPFKSTEDIDNFISERVISRTRPDAGIWLGMVGCNVNSTDVEVFLAGHGTSYNDLFWIDDIPEPIWWDTVYKHKID